MSSASSASPTTSAPRGGSGRRASTFIPSAAATAGFRPYSTTTFGGHPGHSGPLPSAGGPPPGRTSASGIPLSLIALTVHTGSGGGSSPPGSSMGSGTSLGTPPPGGPRQLMHQGSSGNSRGMGGGGAQPPHTYMHHLARSSNADSIDPVTANRVSLSGGGSGTAQQQQALPTAAARGPSHNGGFAAVAALSQRSSLDRRSGPFVALQQPRPPASSPTVVVPGGGPHSSSSARADALMLDSGAILHHSASSSLNATPRSSTGYDPAVQAVQPNRGPLQERFLDALGASREGGTGGTGGAAGYPLLRRTDSPILPPGPTRDAPQQQQQQQRVQRHAPLQIRLLGDGGGRALPQRLHRASSGLEGGGAERTGFHRSATTSDLQTQVRYCPCYAHVLPLYGWVCVAGVPSTAPTDSLPLPLVSSFPSSPPPASAPAQHWPYPPRPGSGARLAPRQYGQSALLAAPPQRWRQQQQWWRRQQ